MAYDTAAGSTGTSDGPAPSPTTDGTDSGTVAPPASS
jgi:hypothetical protein